MVFSLIMTWPALFFFSGRWVVPDFQLLQEPIQFRFVGSIRLLILLDQMVQPLGIVENAMANIYVDQDAARGDSDT